jgi:hypothetical protein
MQQKFFISLFLFLLTLSACTSSPIKKALYDKSFYSSNDELITTTLWYPYAEWTFSGIEWIGNPFDVEAYAVFSDSRNPYLFYDGGSTWKLRYMCTKPGEYTFVTKSSLPGLNGWTGKVHCEDNPGAFGLLTAGGSNNKKFYVKGWEKAIVPVWCMIPNIFTVSDATIDLWIANNIEKTEFRGAHMSGPANRWYDIDCDGTRSSCTSENPDPKTFRKLEEVMDKLYWKGAFLHLWMFSDCQRDKCDKFHDDPRQERLRHYLADRFGAVPNWMIGEGFDNHEDDDTAYANKWFEDINDRLAWSHLLGMRSFNKSYDLICTECNYYSWENLVMTFDIFKASYDITSDRPSFEEDRFRHGQYSEYAFKDLKSLDDQRHYLWWQVMSGGVGAIYGYILDSPGHYSLPEGYPEDWHVTIKAWHDFWYGPPHRFLPDMERCEGKSDAEALCSLGKAYVFYMENTSTIRFDLSEMSGSHPAMAMDTASGLVLDLGIMNSSSYTFTAPYVGDWAIAVGEFAGTE